MRTMQPAIMIGAYGWDQDRLPRDEFDLRVAELHRLMDDQGWAAMLIHGDACEHRMLATYTNFIPRLRWAMALVPRRGEPRLLASISARDVPAMKRMTWIADLRSGWDWAIGFDGWLAGLAKDDAAALGTLGFDHITATLHGAVERSLGNRLRLDDAAPFLPRDRPLRPRELSLARDAGALAAEAADAMRRAWRGGAGAEAAALVGERAARAKGAQDVRTLASHDGGLSLVPFQGLLDARGDRLVAYVAVKLQGFWAEMFVTEMVRPSALLRRAEAALAAALAAAAPGAAHRRVHELAMAPLEGCALHPVLQARVGRRIGLSLDEGAELAAASDGRMEAGSVYALHVGSVDGREGGALVSAMVAISASGATLLC